MEGNIKISADLTEAIQKLSEKLGIAADAIIPEYTKNIMVNGISWMIGGLLLAILPWFVLPSSVDLSFIEYTRDRQMWQCIYIVARLGICLVCSWGGGYEIFDYVENITTPKAMAIKRLLNQIT